MEGATSVCEGSGCSAWVCVASLTYDVDSATHKDNSKLATGNTAYNGLFFFRCNRPFQQSSPGFTKGKKKKNSALVSINSTLKRRQDKHCQQQIPLTRTRLGNSTALKMRGKKNVHVYYRKARKGSFWHVSHNIYNSLSENRKTVTHKMFPLEKKNAKNIFKTLYRNSCGV